MSSRKYCIISYVNSGKSPNNIFEHAILQNEEGSIITRNHHFNQSNRKWSIYDPSSHPARF
uniref:Uncharacterized protein n=1 Tax=Rhizophagus irregularis (strain DAOM 181602 / DAOM 197198 / MUCL 43194) TaxID=747089 RepID=U9TVU2_RHIID